MVALKWIGYLFYLFAVIDLGLYYIGGIDLTGVTWSPIAAGVVGTVLVRLGGSAEE